MVVVFLLHLALSGVSFLTDKQLKNEKISTFRLDKNDLDLIEEIEKIEIELINQGINPDTLTLEQVNELLYKDIRNEKELLLKKQKYKDLQKRIENHLRSS
jgi:hypothetical protein